MASPLAGTVALVAGATRGAGRGIACMLGEAGATVICTGRSVRGHPATPGRNETIEETAAMVTEHGGHGIAIQVDHTDADQVASLGARIALEHGRLDVLVNDIWGGEALTEWGQPFWKLDLDKGMRMLEQAVHTHVINSVTLGASLLSDHPALIVEITDGVGDYYRGTLFYDLVKTTVSRLAFAYARDLRETNATAVAITPGFLRSEAMLDYFGVTADDWRDGVQKDMHFAESESPFYVGRAVAAVAADPHAKRWAGQTLTSGRLAKHYGFTDTDGRQPDFHTYLVELVARCLGDACADPGENLADAFVARLEAHELGLMADWADDGLVDHVRSLGANPEPAALVDAVHRFFRLG